MPDPIDPAQAMGEYMFGDSFDNYQGVTDPRLQERIIGAEEQFRPRYTALELKDIETMAMGLDHEGEHTMGLFDLLEESSSRAGRIQREQLADQREDDVASLLKFAPQIVEGYREADPWSTEIADLQSEQAKRAFARAKGELSPEEQRQVNQGVMQTRGMQGRIRDNSLQADAILGRRMARQSAEQAAMGQGAQAFQMNKALAGDLGSVILGRPSQAVALGQGVLGQAQQGAAGAMGPQLFDPNVGINMAMQQRSQDMEFMAAQDAASAQVMSAAIGAAGSMGSMMCWVAREVYGVDNPDWKLFREWVVFKSPDWFFSLYYKYGEKFANFISNKPRIKSIIRKWMDGIIQRNTSWHLHQAQK